MSAQQTASHNSRSHSSAKFQQAKSRASRSVALKMAANIAREVGLPATWPNVQTIRLAIESETHYSKISVTRAAELIVAAANQFTPVDASMYSFQAAAILRKSNNVNRFWFEDALWRYKDSYHNMLSRWQKAEAAGISIDELENRDREESERQTREAVQWLKDHDRTNQAEAV